MALTQIEVSQLYVAIFNRASEGEGNRYWQTQSDAASAATAMLDTTDSKQYFGSSLDSNQAFIEHIYLNTLNKTITDDLEGINYWTGRLEGGATRGEIVAEMVAVIKNYAPGGPYYDPSDAATVTAYNQFVNRVEVSNYMAERVYDTPVDYAVSTAFNRALPVTDDPATVAGAKSSVDQMAEMVGGFTHVDVSIDTGTMEVPVFFDAGDGQFNFVDDARVFNHVVIENFSSNDRVTFQHAATSDYSYSNDGEDVHIIFNNQEIVNAITLIGVVDPGTLVYDQTSFLAALGFDPITVT
jgi:hypothetical protein